MKRKRRSTGVIAFVVFVAIVIIGGYAFNVTGYADNPFDQIAFLSNWANGGEGRFERQFAADSDSAALSLPSSDSDNTGIDLTGLSTANSQFQLPPVSELDSSDTGELNSFNTEPFAEPDGGDQNSVDWSGIYDVLYDFWFICATTAVFIVIQQVIKSVIKQFKSRLPRMATAK